MCRSHAFPKSYEFWKMMNAVGKTAVIAMLAIATPITSVVVMNWGDFRPYLVGDPKTATGELLFFTAPG